VAKLGGGRAICFWVLWLRAPKRCDAVPGTAFPYPSRRHDMFRLDSRGRKRKEAASEPQAAVAEDQADDQADDQIVIIERSVNPYLVLFHDPTGYRAEQIRGLRNRLIAMNPDGNAKTLVVTSAIRGEGKSVTCLNLAMAFAERERTPVVLVEADMRFPCVERYLQLNPGLGFSDVLLGRVSLEQAVRPSGVRNLDVLAAGGRVTSPAELLTNHHIEEIYARLKERYQYVIVDTPPVTPATDAGVLAPAADGTLFVVRLEHSAKSLAKEAVKNLRELGANLLGVFVTEVRGSKPESDPRLGYGEALQQAQGQEEG